MRSKKGMREQVRTMSKAIRRLYKRKSVKITGSVIAAVAILFIGIGIGDGRLAIGDHHGNATGLPTQLDYSSVNAVYNDIKDNYNGKLTATQMTDGLKHGLAEATNDPYTEYFTPTEAKAFNNELDNSFSGIGAELGQDTSKDLIVIAPITGFPAAKAGLQAQDIITSINGVSTNGMSVDDAVDKIRGPSGSKVTLGIVRDKTQTLTITITRENIQVPSVTTKILPGNIGYMQISSFADDTSQLAQAAANKFVQEHVSGIILDLRENPGGLLDAAVNVSSLWVPEGKLIVEERGTVGTIDHPALGGDVLNGIATVVLIDSGSASASEITAGALHDNGEARLIGVKSFGKGVVQQLINFPDGSELKVTVASWYRPNGQNIEHKGITPDQIVSLTDAQLTAGNDTQLKAAETYLMTSH
jgi:carboxyl-terminal processing protease